MLIDTLLWGTRQADPEVTVHFVPAGGFRAVDGWTAATSEGFTAFERARFKAAFDAISAVTNVDFTVTSDPEADFQIVLDTDEIRGDYLAVFNPPGVGNEGVGLFDGSSWDRYGGDLKAGGAGFATIVHELLHGLGLAHPHDEGGRSTRMAGVTAPFGDFGTFGLNQGVFTTMSYNPGHTGGDSAARAPWTGLYGYEIGPMALDIAALQSIYGARDHATGKDVYVLPDHNRSGTGWRAIWDTGGRDEIRHDGDRDAVIDLRQATLKEAPGGGGFLSSATGIAGGYTIAKGVVIERATGGQGDDVLTGNAADNLLTGRGGGDRLAGRGGDDWLRGSGGGDRLSGGAGADRLDGGGGQDRLSGGGGGDSLSGGAGRDVLSGGGGGDVLSGQGGADRLSGGGGADRLAGRDGDDRLRGGDGDDILHGGRGADRIAGGAGQDRLWGQAGADVFDFDSRGDSRAGAGTRDSIADFTRGRDLIDLRGIDADVTRGGNQAAEWIGNAGFSGTAGELRTRALGGDRIVALDQDGDGRPDVEIRVAGTPWLGADDFLF